MEVQRLRYTDHSRPLPDEPPKVDVVMIQIREDAHPWVQEAVASVAQQTYHRVGLVQIDNRSRALTIGAAWNEAIRHSDADLVLMMGDDDQLSMDLVSSLVEQFEQLRVTVPNVVHLTSMCTVVDETTSKVGHVQVQHTGMFLRQYLLDHPFDETLSRNVGLEKMQAMSRDMQELGEPYSMGIRHHYGYIWRQHAFMANGRPIQL